MVCLSKELQGSAEISTNQKRAPCRPLVSYSISLESQESNHVSVELNAFRHRSEEMALRRPTTFSDATTLFIPSLCSTMTNALKIFLVVLLLAIKTSAETTGCLSSTNELALEESKVTDLTTTREYILCENRSYRIGFLDSFGTALSEDSDMIQLRPNLHIKCGASGSRENQCLVQSGDIQVDGTSMTGISSSDVDNVVIKGLTFLDASQYMVKINKPGNVLFQDCEFRVR